VLRNGSPLQLRYFPLGSLSQKSLGTNAMMLLMIPGVKRNHAFSPNNICHVIRHLQGQASGQRVNKTESLADV
jgi:hypothetical protein